MPSKNDSIDWREARRQAARDTIVDAAWRLVHEEGLAALSIRELAKAAGITTPTVYSYFDSKHAIYDAMFERAATEFADYLTAPYDSADPREVLTAGVHRFIEFCTADAGRYQLLFQRTIPDFEPSERAYAPAIRALDHARQRLADVGITDPGALDMWTALNNGLVDQQISNDPGGTRWATLADELVEMYLSHYQRTRRVRKGK